MPAVPAAVVQPAGGLGLAAALRAAGGAAGKPVEAAEVSWDERDLQQTVLAILRELYHQDGGGVAHHYKGLTTQIQNILADLAAVRRRHDEKLFVAVLEAMSKVNKRAPTASEHEPATSSGTKRKEAELGPARAARRQRRSEVHQHLMGLKDNWREL
jgi:hypothetical protein